ncbi:MAG: hypothetical protein Fur0022_00830 [Anaerolineales bacterium]
MNKTPQPHNRFFAGLFALAAICAGMRIVRDWLTAWAMSFPVLGWLPCCDMGMQRNMGFAWPFDLRLEQILGGGLLVFGIGTLIWKVWQTRRGLDSILQGTAPYPLPEKLMAALPRAELQKSIVVVASSEPIAFCFGFFRPRICLSLGLIELLSPHQLKATLLHEEHHRHSYDPLRILLIETLSTILFFLPVFREWAEITKVRLELAADGYAIANVGKSALAGALHRLLSGGRGISSPVQTGIAIAGLNTNAMRIASLLGDRTVPLLISAPGFLQSSFGLGVICLLLMF